MAPSYLNGLKRECTKNENLLSSCNLHRLLNNIFFEYFAKHNDVYVIFKDFDAACFFPDEKLLTGFFSRKMSDGQISQNSKTDNGESTLGWAEDL